MLGRTQDTDSAVAPYTVGCGRISWAAILSAQFPLNSPEIRPVVDRTTTGGAPAIAWQVPGGPFADEQQAQTVDSLKLQELAAELVTLEGEPQ
jgi:hypothetical protein